jgi:transcription elongation factor GreA
MKQRILTKDGLEKIKAELHELKDVRLPDIIEKIERAKELGDLSENAEYHDAKDQQGMTISRIMEIEQILKDAIISEGPTAIGVISIGTTFVAVDAKGTEREYTIVGFNEADPLNGRISNESPLGQAFYGKKKGDSVEISVPKGILTYKIVSIK